MHSLIVYCFPLILVSFEALLRNLVEVDTFGFIGPTLAATGISFLVPLTKLKSVDIEDKKGDYWTPVSNRDQNFVSFMWLFLFVSLFIWFWICTLSIKGATTMFMGLPAQAIAGASLYISSIVLSTIKEYV